MEANLLQRIQQEGWEVLRSWPKTQRIVDSPLYGAQGELFANNIRNKIVDELVEGSQPLQYLCVRKNDLNRAKQITNPVFNEYF